MQAPVELVKRVKPMLRHVRSLTKFAVVEVPQHRFTLDVNARVAELDVALLLQSP